MCQFPFTVCHCILSLQFFYTRFQTFPPVCQFPLTVCLFISSLQFFYTRLQTLSSCVSVSLHCVSLNLVIAVLLHQVSDLSFCVSVSLDSVSLYLIIAVLLHQASDTFLLSVSFPLLCASISHHCSSSTPGFRHFPPVYQFLFTVCLYISSLQFFYTRLQTLSSCVSVSLDCVSLYLIIAVLLH